MKIKFIAPLLVFTLLFSCDEEKTVNNTNLTTQENRKIPIPTEMHDKMESQINDPNYQSKRLAWWEFIHSTANPDFDWKMENSNNFRNKLKVKEKFSSNKAVETFADGYLTGEWFERGSRNQAGNLRITDYDDQSETIYAIADNGSVWKSSLDGSNWHVISDYIQFGRRVIKTVRLNDGTLRILAAIGRGIWYTDDEGLNWVESTGITGSNGTGINLVQLNDADKTILYLYNSGGNNRLAKSTDNGASFINVQNFGAAGSYFASMTHSHNASIAYVLDRTSNLYKFQDGALTVVNSSLGIGATSYSQVVSTITSTDTTLYILKDRNELYKSTNAGVSFSFVGNLPTETWEVGIEVAEDNPNHIYYGEVELYRSNNGGVSFTKVADWWEYYDDVPNKIHADMMEIKSYKKQDGTEFSLIPNHGGISVSYNHLLTTPNIGMLNLNIGQFYDVITSPINSNYIFGGTQDQGYLKTTNANSTSGVLDFVQEISGDYGYLQFSHGGQTLWTQYPGGWFSVYPNAILDGGWGSADYSMDGFDLPVYGWILPTAAAANPASNFIYVAGGNVYGGAGSHLIKLIYNSGVISFDQLDFDFKDVSGAAIASIDASKIDANRLYVGTENGKFYYSNDNGDNWTQGVVNGPSGYWIYGTDILSSKLTSNLVYFAGSGYAGPGVFKSIDGGQTFIAAGTGLPNTYIHDMEFSPDESLIFAATDAGPYVYVVHEERWYDLTGATTPVVEFMSVEYVQDLNIVRFGTFGRGIWDFNIETNTAKVKEENLTQNLVYPNPNDGKNVQINSSVNGIIEIYNLQGQKVFRTGVMEGHNSINYSLNSGMYLYVISNNNQLIHKGKLEVIR